MAGSGDSSDESKDTEPAWHERTSTVVGASVAALLALGLAWLAISYVAKDFNDPAPTPQYFLEPSASGGGTTTPSSPTTTTETITSTSPPVTTDINPGDPTSTSVTSGTDTSPTDTTLPRTRRSTANNDDDGPTSTRQRPRLNETRTLYPRP
ncbi:MAG: hypothetical protein ABW137_34735 [Mycobacterium sp.]